MCDITIISCNYNTKRFAELLVKSIKTFSSNNYKIVIMDNSIKQELYDNKEYEVIRPDKNMGHGPGLDYLINNHVKTKFTLIMDIDTHILRDGWDKDLIDIMNKNDKIALIAPERCAAKPIHPGMMFVRTNIFVENNIFFHAIKLQHPDMEGMALDVGQCAPILLSAKLKLQTFTLKRKVAIYKDTRGDTWELCGKPTFFHFGYSRANNEIINKLKDNLFNQINF